MTTSKKHDTINHRHFLRESDGTKTITYYHGGSGIVGFNYNGTDYYFRKNLQGDVTEIYTSAGAKVASYAYDAWGKVLAVNNDTDDNIGDLNPIRYRGYYYDVEIGMYYLQSRYYDAGVGRFINADDHSMLNIELGFLSNNLFAYCDNNPIMNSDPMGLAKWWINIKITDWLIKIVDVVIVILAAFLVCLAAVKAQALVQKVCTWFAKNSLKKKLEKLVFKLAGLIVEAIHTVVYKIADRGTRMGFEFFNFCNCGCNT